ncbi:heparinase II/III family protein [Alkalihalobacillus hwajinpoensis]|uniref:heparinase II/III domain-containing protein n=1 Tax=Guptibacillus hwajinpoensis TaxID=208199 RepID=UPI0018839DE1|nr:heparinase II/III family protein [Pseudalkalibacillus hwajinpoensis]MBF0708789.1 heparinase II/III family protein [Pseudalkalibacillus hwajinpoensis]
MSSRLSDTIYFNAQHEETLHAKKKLIAEADEALQIPFRPSKTDIADWGHYFHCPYDGAALNFSWTNNKKFDCPSCRRVFEDSPFLGGWMGMAHGKLGEAVKHLSFAYAATKRDDYLLKANKILLDYAECYPHYRTHGKIPYNGPGKLFAQTLDEANWMINLCYAYHIGKEHFTKEELELVNNQLFLDAATFLSTWKEQQIHNHAVHITVAICMIGSILGNVHLIEQGFNGDYGLRNQIRKGVLEDGLWYEGSFSYHFYTLESIVQLAHITDDTRLWSFPEIKKMFDTPLLFIDNEGLLPSLNDSSSSISLSKYAHLYEFAFSIYGEEQYQIILRSLYGMQPSKFKRVPRDSYSLFFVNQFVLNNNNCIVPSCKNNQNKTLTSSSSLTKISCENGWQVFQKHAPFGGEHDHLDQLGLSLSLKNKPFIRDPGTTRYSVPVHYDWFKHTYSHNTVSINGSDQPPADGKRIKAEQCEWGSWVESVVDWKSDTYLFQNLIQLPESMSSWDVESYKDCSIQRFNAITDRLFLDIVTVNVPEKREVDLLYHVDGHVLDTQNWKTSQAKLSKLNQDLFNNKREMMKNGSTLLQWKANEETVNQHSWCSSKTMLYLASTPDNPPVANRATLIQRSKPLQSITFINVFQMATDLPNREVENIEVIQSESEIKIFVSTHSSICGEFRLTKGKNHHSSTLAYYSS